MPFVTRKSICALTDKDLAGARAVGRSFGWNRAETSGDRSVNRNDGTSACNVHIGGGGAFDTRCSRLAGQIDELVGFQKAIPAARIAEHFKAGKEGGVVTSGGPADPLLASSTLLTVAWSGNSTSNSWASAGRTLQSAPTLNSAARVCPRYQDDQSHRGRHWGRQELLPGQAVDKRPNRNREKTGRPSGLLYLA